MSDSSLKCSNIPSLKNLGVSTLQILFKSELFDLSISLVRGGPRHLRSDYNLKWGNSIVGEFHVSSDRREFVVSHYVFNCIMKAMLYQEKMEL